MRPGRVAVGDPIGGGAGQEQTVVGETPNLAARLQALTEPGTVVIAASTQRLTGGLFEYRDLGAVSLKGFAVRAWLGTGPAESRFEALRATTTPLVGRDEEIDLLLRGSGQRPPRLVPALPPPTAFSALSLCGFES